MNETWQIQDAKNKLSEVIARALAQGPQLITKHGEKTVVTIEDGVEKGASISVSLEITESRAKGIVAGLPVIGTWKSKDGAMFYLAVGGFVEPERK